MSELRKPKLYTTRFQVNGNLTSAQTRIDGAWVSPFVGSIEKIVLIFRSRASSGNTNTVIDVNKDGSSILTTPYVSPRTSGVGPHEITNIADRTLSVNSVITVDIDAVAGSWSSRDRDLTLVFTIRMGG